MIKAVLISTYELGRQPFGLASPAAWLRGVGVEVICLDLYQEKLSVPAVRAADLVAFYLPMHTATRIALKVIEKVRELNPSAHLCAYGLYAPLNAEILWNLGISTILGGEFEEGLLSLAQRLVNDGTEKGFPAQNEPLVSLARQKFLVPDRSGLPVLERYAQLTMPNGARRIVGYTEATRGCKHLCRHCPIVPVYKGQFRVVQREVVLEDIRRQVKQGAQHITFGDPDFFNGIKHAVELVRALHGEFPNLTYDVVIKIEHLLKHAEHLPTLRETNCAFVTSAVEAIDDKILAIFDKGHTRDDFIKAVELCHETGIIMIPTFVAFTPWITLEGYEAFLETLASLNMVDHVSPIQLAIRLLIPAGSRLLELSEVRELIGPFDQAALSYRWKHPDPRMDELQRDVEALVRKLTSVKANRRTIFGQVWLMLQQVKGTPWKQLSGIDVYKHRCTVPYLNEPWYC
jgi:radical SAM superfamily enzyme YgiQ (UPF0313 family)